MTRRARSKARTGTPTEPGGGASLRPSLSGATAESRWTFLVAALGLAAVALGAFARLWAIGRWPVSFDEFLMGMSVRNILARGLPRFAEGGYYVRGILVQYLMAAVRLLGFGEEFSLRIVPALSNLAALPAVYLLARRISGRWAAWLAVALCALSAWEIEFSRFARMYAPFQAIFVWFAYFLERFVTEKDERSRLALYLLASASILVHETSVFLAVLLFLPLAVDRRGARIRDVVLPAVVLAAAIYVNATDFRSLGPAEESASVFSWPDVLGRVLLPWIAVLPRLTAMSALLLLVAVAGIAGAKGASAGGVRRIGMLLALGALLVALVRTPYVSTRYSYFLLPLLLVADAAALEGLARRLLRSAALAAPAFLVLSATFLLLSEDVRPDRLLRAATAETNFRLGAGWLDWNHYLPRVDYRTPAEFIREHRTGGETVVSLALPVDFYLDRPLDVFYLAREDPEFRNHFDPRNGRDRWTGARIVTDEESLFKLIDGASGTTWLVAGTAAYPYKQAASRKIAERYRAYGRFRGLDGRLGVYAIPGNRPAAGR